MNLKYTVLLLAFSTFLSLHAEDLPENKTEVAPKLVIPETKLIDRYSPPKNQNNIESQSKGAVFIKEQHHFNQLISIPALETKANEILTKLKIAANAQHVDVRLIFNNNQSYANTSTADGSIFITRTTLEDIKTDDELAFIIAHELSHFLLQHHDIDVALSLFSKAYNLLNVIYNAKSSNNTFSDDDMNKSAQFILAKGVYETVIASGFQRNQEEEADALGIDLMVKAGYNPKFLSSFFDKFETHELENKKVFVKESYVTKTQNNIRIDLDSLFSDAFEQALYELSAKHPDIKLRREFIFSYIEKHHSPAMSRKSAKDFILTRDANKDSLHVYKKINALSKSLTNLSTLDNSIISSIESNPYGVVPHAKFYTDAAKNNGKPSLNMLKSLIDGRQNGLPPMDAYRQLANYYLSINDTDSAIKTADLMYEDYSQSPIAKNYLIDIYSRSDNFVYKAKAALMQRDFLGIM